jgi:recombination protein RecT
MPQMVTTKDKMQTVRSLVERQIPEIKRAVPRGIDPQRFARVALTTFQNVPALLDCTPASLMGAMMQAAAWGLELDPVLGMAYLVPYRERCQLIIGYQGLIELARRSGEVRNVMARAVYERDKFTYRFGLDETLEHVPHPGEDAGPLVYVYAIAYLSNTLDIGRNGTPVQGKVFDVMSIAEVEKIRERSAAKNSGPWKSDYEAMAKKTVIRRLCKYLPKSVELASALNLDEQADRAEQTLTIDVPLSPAQQLKDGTSSLDQLTASLQHPAPPIEGDDAAPDTSAAALAAPPRQAPRPVAFDPRPATPPAPTSRDEAKAAQASRHEVPRAHREPGEEG